MDAERERAEAEKEYVKKVFGRLKRNELYLREHDLPLLNTAFQLAVVAPGHSKRSAVEELALKRAQAAEYNMAVARCVNRLGAMERKIIYESFLRREKKHNWEIWEELYISKTLFYETKQKAIEKLAILFEMEGL